MAKRYSDEEKLDDVVKDIDTEKMILENIRRCSKVVGKVFRVIFWHENLLDKDYMFGLVHCRSLPTQILNHSCLYT